MIYLGILLLALVIGILLKTVQASLPRPLRFLLLILAVYLLQTCTDQWIYGTPQPAPTRAELAQLFDDYPDAGVWAGTSAKHHRYYEYGTFAQLVLGMEIPQLSSTGADRAVNGGVLWSHRMKMALPDRVVETANNNRVYLDENHPPPAPLLLTGYLDMDNVLQLMATWEVPAPERANLAALLLDLIDTRLAHPEWPGFRDSILDLDYAVALLDHIGHPLEDQKRIAGIREVLVDCYVSADQATAGFASPGEMWVDSTSTLHAIELMDRYGVPETVDLERVRIALERRWGGMEDFEFFGLEDGIALMRLNELEATLAAAQ